MAWDEWEQLKAAAAQRQSTGMQLNSHLSDSDGGPSQGDLRVRNADLEAVGKAAHDLFDDFGVYSRHAQIASEAAAGGLKSEGYALGAALGHVATRWSEQSRSLLDACAHISNHLRYTQTLHGGADSYIGGAVSSISVLDRGFDERKGH
ncbi:hypothetical protein IAG44_17540 [Streptomyces roseirectus]|uniref:AG1 protein n=1 Tax=Streptomyces roseirectus TaxID=2768066 RepID=A0A7H0IE43_9ACTN|nr:hypothetical protein [Streptomyces roseirectus]QNP71059.1 hypothetical protein IAG44_17540 [Streptomyces roseirectus]